MTESWAKNRVRNLFVTVVHVQITLAQLYLSFGNKVLTDKWNGFSTLMNYVRLPNFRNIAKSTADCSHPGDQLLKEMKNSFHLYFNTVNLTWTNIRSTLSHKTFGKIK